MSEVNIFDQTFGALLPYGIGIWCIAVVMYILHECWKFINDGDVKWSIALFAFPLFFAAGTVIGFSLLTIVHVIVITIFPVIPLAVYISVLSFVALLFVARYVRRLHKAIYKHVSDPKAHTKQGVAEHGKRVRGIHIGPDDDGL